MEDSPASLVNCGLQRLSTRMPPPKLISALSTRAVGVLKMPHVLRRLSSENFDYRTPT